MPISDDLAGRLPAHLARPRGKRYSVRHIERIVGTLGEIAGIPDLAPTSFRHTVGVWLFRALGPAATHDSLGVSAPTLDFYTKLRDGPRIRSVREVMVEGAAPGPRAQAVPARHRNRRWTPGVGAPLEASLVPPKRASPDQSPAPSPG